jgi:hypothetical protein
MATIRVLVEDDIPAVAALFARVYPEHRWISQDACESYFREMLFNNPWCDLQLPSWVAEDDGSICGCYAVIPRRMLLRGRPIRVAVGCQFIVDPSKRDSLVWLALVKSVISGPQDLTLVDGANDQAQRLSTRLGWAAPLLYNLHWTRPLRPARYALSLLEKRSAASLALVFPARPLAGLADALAARLPPSSFTRQDAEFLEEALDPTTMSAHLPDVVNGVALQPEYEARALAWLLDQAARKTRHGALRARAVRDSSRRLIGWYLYYVSKGNVGEVLQIAARDESFDRVLRSLLADAWRQGATAVRGRLEPRFVQDLSDRHCWLRREGSWTLVHSRHADVIAAIQQGDSFLSRLEGEWWMRFLGEQAASR